MDEHYEEFVTQRRLEIMELVADACHAAGRSPDELVVQAVSKTVDFEAVRVAWKVGWRVFAENRPQELVRKTQAAQASPDMAQVRFDMIGNLQKNKINSILGRAYLVHSVSSEHLAESLSRRALVAGRIQPILLEVNVSGEETKSGFTPEEIRASAERIVDMEGIQVLGLMTMAPVGDRERARRTFAGLRELRDVLSVQTGLPLSELSCGMSDDFGEAIAEGSTILRLGRVVFSPDYHLSVS